MSTVLHHLKYFLRNLPLTWNNLVTFTLLTAQNIDASFWRIKPLLKIGMKRPGIELYIIYIFKPLLESAISNF